MKKLLLITLALLFTGTMQLFSANPIPSYDVKVTNKANFQEKNNNLFGSQPGKERRQMNIETSTASSTGNEAGKGTTVYVYQLDGGKVLGPFFVAYGDQLTVEINDFEWGAVIELDKTGTKAIASVWITPENY